MISLILITLNGIAKAVSDTLAHHFHISIFKTLGKWWTQTSWENKYISDNKIVTWLLSNPLVFLTDAWHFFNFIQTITLLTAIVFYNPIFGLLDVGLLLVARSVSFHVFYTYILSRK